MKKFILLITISFSSVALFAQSNERKEVENAILNYMNAFYEADTTKAYESIAPYLAKRGYYKKDGVYAEATMSFPQLVRLAQRWKASQTITDASPRKITIFEVLDQTASAKLEAIWGIDYFHLAKRDGKWVIINVLWQEYPKG